MDKPPFEAVYDAHYDDVWRFLLHASADVQTALDLTSQTFLRAYRAWPRFRQMASPRSWLMTIAVNEWRRELRRRMISRVIPFIGNNGGENDIELIESEVEGVAEEIERNEAYKSLQQALARLPEKYSTPLVLRYFEYLSIEEVAAILKRPTGTVKSLIHRGIAKLREDQGLREACGETLIDISQLSVEKQ